MLSHRLVEYESSSSDEDDEVKTRGRTSKTPIDLSSDDASCLNEEVMQLTNHHPRRICPISPPLANIDEEDSLLLSWRYSPTSADDDIADLVEAMLSHVVTHADSRRRASPTDRNRYRQQRNNYGSEVGEFEVSLISSSSSSDIDTDDATDSDDEVKFLRFAPKKIGPAPRPRARQQNVGQARVRGELLLEDLPPIEKLQITVSNEVRLLRVGRISSIVDCLVVVHSDPDVPAFDETSVFFNQTRKAIGQVFEVFGAVTRPHYSLRFNSADEIGEYALAIGQLVFCAPDLDQFTHTVFTDALRRCVLMRGSDASWEDDVEPPPEHVDYSDDEEERRAKAKRRNCTGDARAEPSGGATPGEQKRFCRGGRGRGGGRGGRGAPPLPRWPPGGVSRPPLPFQPRAAFHFPPPCDFSRPPPPYYFGLPPPQMPRGAFDSFAAAAAMARMRPT